MEQRIHETVVITASEGKVFRRIADGSICGKEIWLGYTYYIGGEKLEEPHMDVPEDFEEVEETEEIKQMYAANNPKNKIKELMDKYSNGQ